MKFSDSDSLRFEHDNERFWFFVELLDTGNCIKTEHVEPTDYCQWCF